MIIALILWLLTYVAAAAVGFILHALIGGKIRGVEIEYAWCPCCCLFRPVKVEPLDTPDRFEREFLTGDMKCERCGAVVASIARLKPNTEA
jgi:hypothetical protein